MKKIFCLAVMAMSLTAHADVQLTCKTETAEIGRIQHFFLKGSSQGLDQTNEIQVMKSTYKPGDQVKSVSNFPTQGTEAAPALPEVPKYKVTQVGRTPEAEGFSFQLEGGGDFRFSFDSSTQNWVGSFVRPFGPEFPEILKNCELLSAEPGFTIRNEEQNSQ